MTERTINSAFVGLNGSAGAAQLAAQRAARPQLAVRRQQHLVRRLRLSHHAELARQRVARHQLRRAVVQPALLPGLRQSGAAAGRGQEHRRRHHLEPGRPQREAGALRQQDPRLHHQHHAARRTSRARASRAGRWATTASSTPGAAREPRLAGSAQRGHRQAVAAPRQEHGVARRSTTPPAPGSSALRRCTWAAASTTRPTRADSASYTTVDLYAEYRFAKDWSVQGRITNLSDETVRNSLRLQPARPRCLPDACGGSRSEHRAPRADPRRPDERQVAPRRSAAPRRGSRSRPRTARC